MEEIITALLITWENKAFSENAIRLPCDERTLHATIFSLEFHQKRIIYEKIIIYRRGSLAREGKNWACGI
jgi:hypothetical protein